jgi:ABC-2 type transport system permease protein
MMLQTLSRSALLIGHQMLAFVFRNYHLTRRYFGWMVVFSFYAIVNSATIALIGVSVNDPRLTMTLVIGAMLWGFLSLLFNEVAMAIAYERWEGTLEYTFMAPVSRFAHLIGESVYAVFYSIVRLFLILVGVTLFVDLDLSHANWVGLVITLLVSSLAFIGLGLIAATLPSSVPNAERKLPISFRAVCCWSRASTIRWKCCPPGCSRWRSSRPQPMRYQHAEN